MKCPQCNSALESRKLQDVSIETCPSCKGMFLLQEELKAIEKKKDPDLAWLDFELWRHRDQYEAVRGDLDCPSCTGHFHTLSYPDSKVKIEVCHECRGVWMNEETLKNLHRYLESRIVSESIPQYLKDLGHEFMQILTGHENVKSLGIVLKLLQYRIFSEIPFIKNLIQSLPKV